MVALSLAMGFAAYRQDVGQLVENDGRVLEIVILDARVESI
jgi:hypothetical protein